MERLPKACSRLQTCIDFDMRNYMHRPEEGQEGVSQGLTKVRKQLDQYDSALGNGDQILR
jgi:hypothetical protein